MFTSAWVKEDTGWLRLEARERKPESGVATVMVRFSAAVSGSIAAAGQRETHIVNYLDGGGRGRLKNTPTLVPRKEKEWLEFYFSAPS